MGSIQSGIDSICNALDETDSSPDEATAVVAHTRGPPLRPIALHPRKSVLDMLRTQCGPCLGRLREQRTHRERLVRVVLWALLPAHAFRIRAAPEPMVRLPLAEHRRGARPVRRVAHVRVFERLLDLEAGDGQRADHLEREEADDVDGVVAGLEVERGGKVEELFEALGFAVGKRGLTTVGIVLILLPRHLTRRIIGFLWKKKNEI